MTTLIERRKLGLAALGTLAVTVAGVGFSAASGTFTGSTATGLVAIDVTGGGAEQTTYANNTGEVNIPGVLDAIVLAAAPGEARLGAVSLNGHRVLDAASIACGPEGPAVLLAPVAGTVLPSTPSADTHATIDGVGPVVLNLQVVQTGGTRVSGLVATYGGHTVTLLEATCAGYTPPNGAGLTGAAASGPAGNIGITVEVPTGAPTAAPATGLAGSPKPGTSASPAASGAPATPTVAPILPTPSHDPDQPGVAPAPSPVAGAGGVTG